MKKFKCISIVVLMFVALVSVSANADVVKDLGPEQILSSDAVVVCCNSVLGQNVVITRLPNDEIAVDIINTDGQENKKAVMTKHIAASSHSHGISISGFTADNRSVNIHVSEVKGKETLICTVRLLSNTGDTVNDSFEAASIGFGNNLQTLDYSNSSYEKKMYLVENCSKGIKYLKQWVNQISGNK